MEKLTYAKDEEELSRAVIIKHYIIRPPERRVSQPPPPRPGANPGPHP